MSRDETMDLLLGAYALDALDDAEREAVEAYLLESPEARAEARRLGLAADALAGAETEPLVPEGSWERVRSAMLDGTDDPRGDGEQALPPLRLPLPPRPVGTGAAVVSLDQARRSRSTRPRRVVATVLAAAAAVVVGVGVGVVAARDSTPPSEVTIEQLAADALMDADARVGTLSGPGTPGVRAVVDPSGRGYLFAADLPSLPAGRTYQLWTLDSATPVSLAVLGPDPEVIAFPAGAGARTLAITDEPAPGATAPGQAPLATGTLA